ncbi:hypothetical protein [Mesorhizobium sp. M0586]|uniref:hypothetical protein n=1 Tax=unclassified Mesorhizobium TaxID=325217 RepID=UPI003339F0B4
MQAKAVTAGYNFSRNITDVHTKEGTLGVAHGYLPDMDSVIQMFTGIDADVEMVECWSGSTTIAIFTKTQGQWQNVFVAKPPAQSIKIIS